MTSEIDKLKHFYIEDYSGIYFTDELNNGEEFLYTTIGIKDDKVDINNIDLIKLDINYNIQWKECSCLKGIRLEDVTVELEEESYEEMRNNK